MNTSIASPSTARARAVEFAPDLLVIHLQDGRSLSVPLEWFPRLRDAQRDQRERWELLGTGSGIHWPELDEDISVAGLLGMPD
ncbi:MAG: DUF2442 domain-containing protein [Chloroflexota bacterium]